MKSGPTEARNHFACYLHRLQAGIAQITLCSCTNTLQSASRHLFRKSWKTQPDTSFTNSLLQIFRDWSGSTKQIRGNLPNERHDGAQTQQGININQHKVVLGPRKTWQHFWLCPSLTVGLCSSSQPGSSPMCANFGSEQHSPVSEQPAEPSCRTLLQRQLLLRKHTAPQGQGFLLLLQRHARPQTQPPPCLAQRQHLGLLQWPHILQEVPKWEYSYLNFWSGLSQVIKSKEHKPEALPLWPLPAKRWAAAGCSISGFQPAHGAPPKNWCVVLCLQHSKCTGGKKNTQINPNNEIWLSVT